MNNLFDQTPVFKTIFDDEQLMNEKLIYKRSSTEFTQEYTSFMESLVKKAKLILKIILCSGIIWLVLWLSSDLINCPNYVTRILGYIFFLDIIIKICIFKFSDHVIDFSKKPAVKEKIKQLEKKGIVEMNLPEGADTMEIFIPKTKEEISASDDNYDGWICENRVMSRYYDESYLYLADMLRTIRIPLESFKSISPKPLGGRISTWLQTYPAKEKTGVKFRNAHNIIVPFYTIEIFISGRSYNLCIPFYELESFCDITGLTKSDI